MNESPTPFARHVHYSPQSPQRTRASWATTLSFPLAGIWALLFARFVSLPSWLTVTLLIIGFATIFLGFIAIGVELDNWRKSRQ